MVYFDNAATSFPKPSAVVREVERALTVYGGNPGRGSHPLSVAASERIFACRSALARYLGAEAPERIVFTLNATYALNFCIKGLIPNGSHVLLSDMEHNAVWRPLEARRRRGELTYSEFPTFAAQRGISAEERTGKILREIRARITPETRALLCTHTSNVTSLTLPVEEIGALCREMGIRFMVDVSQSAGHQPVSMARMGADVLCGAGHKGLMGIQGVGFAAFGRDVIPEPIIEGGSGYRSLLPTMPEELPEREEAGTLPTPAIGGLLAGVRWLENQNAVAMHRRMEEIARYMREELQKMSGVRVYCPDVPGPTLLFSHQNLDAAYIGAYLGERGICVRTGHHCAALAHRTLGTPPDGAVRLSLGPMNQPAEAETFLRCLRQMQKGRDFYP